MFPYFTKNYIAFTLTGGTPGVACTATLKVYNSLFSNLFGVLLNAQGITDSGGNCYFEFQNELNAYLYNRRINDLPGYRPTENNSGVLNQAVYQNAYTMVKFDVTIIMADNSASSYWQPAVAYYGSQSFFDFKFSNKMLAFNNAAAKQYWTNKPLANDYYNGTNELLTFFFFQDSTLSTALYFIVKKYYANGTSAIGSTYFSLKTNVTALLRMNNNDPAVTMIECYVSNYASGNNKVTETRTFNVISNNYYALKTFGYRNSYGQLETITLTGQRIRKPQRSDTRSFNNLLTANYLAGAGKSQNLYTISDGYELNSGFIKAGAMPMLAELLASEDTYELITRPGGADQYLVPVIITDKNTTTEIERSDTEDRQVTLNITYNFDGIR